MTIRKQPTKTLGGYIQAGNDSPASLAIRLTGQPVENIRRYQLSLTSRGLGIPNVNAAMTTLHLFFAASTPRCQIMWLTSV